ncbi:hypothetical protein [Enemella dayhoffiae]|uniref:hypothetical protein n=1 Tax=Enemella dayhoffiae TaxID=2016507 RepID=UPI00114056E0|nr:hypothetical protein [Enemella dayhoffiae]
MSAVAFALIAPNPSLAAPTAAPSPTPAPTPPFPAASAAPSAAPRATSIPTSSPAPTAARTTVTPSSSPQALAPAAAAAPPSATGSIQQLWQCDPPAGANQSTYNCADGWVTGNNDGPYLEGQTVPYRTRFEGLTPGAQYYVTIEWDTTKSGKHASTI